MPYNLIHESWIPVRRKSGRADWLAPWQITEADDAPVALTASGTGVPECAGTGPAIITSVRRRKNHEENADIRGHFGDQLSVRR